MPRAWSDASILAYLVLVPLVQLYLALWIHEIGHALMGAIGGLRITSIGVGLGRPVAAGSLGRIRVFAGSFPMVGLVQAIMPDYPSDKRALVRYFAGGVLANLIAALGFLVATAGLSFGSYVWLLGAIANLSGLANALPFRIKTGENEFQSDGRLILELVRRGIVEPSMPEILERLESHRPLLLRVRDHAMLRMHLVSAASELLTVGAIEGAAKLLDEAATLDAHAPPFCLGLGKIVEASVRAEQGRPDESDVLFREGISILKDGGAEVSLVLAEMARSLAAEKRGIVAPGSVDRIAEENADRLARCPHAEGMAFAYRVASATAREDQAAVESLERELPRLTASRPCLSRDLRIHRLLMRYHLRRSGRLPAFLNALQILTRITGAIGACSLPGPRSRMEEALSSLRKEAENVLKVMGKTDRVEFMPRAVSPPAARPYRRLARRLLAVDLGVFIAAAAAVIREIAAGPRSAPPPRVLTWLLAYGLAAVPHFLVLGLLPVALGAIRRFRPGFEWDSDPLAILILIGPWLWMVVFAMVV